LNIPTIGIFKPIFTNPLNCEGDGGIPKIEAKKPFLKAILKHILSPSKTNKKEETKANLKPFI
jgi:hypothetical protein